MLHKFLSWGNGETNTKLNVLALKFSYFSQIEEIVNWNQNNYEEIHKKMIRLSNRYCSKLPFQILHFIGFGFYKQGK